VGMKHKILAGYSSLTQNHFFQAMVYTLLFLLIVLVAREVKFIFHPIVVLLSTLFLPVLLAGIFYYLFSPLVRLMNRGKFPKIAAILVVYTVLAVVTVLSLVLGIPVLSVQINSLIEHTPALVDTVRASIEEFGKNEFISRFLPEVSVMTKELPAKAAELVKVLYGGIIQNIAGFLGFLANLIIVFLTVPFILFFMLKDGNNLPQFATRFFPDEYKDEASSIVSSMGATLGAYIQGQLLVSLFVGVMMLIGYALLGIEFALLLAIVALVTNLIPYVGPLIGAVPGLIVALTHGSGKMIQVLILVLIVQQLENQLVSPLVIGKKLKIHPLVIIFLLLTAGSLAGFFGLLLAVPAFAVVRTAVSHMYRLVMLRKTARAAVDGKNDT
jgi:predicted PurR-regulated permease PerM